MKKIFKTLLLILVLAMVVASVLLFAYRLEVLSYMTETAGISDTNAPSVDAISASEMINLELISSKRLDSLVNQVVNFDFDNICRRPRSLQSANAACALGNGQPFK